MPAEMVGKADQLGATEISATTRVADGERRSLRGTLDRSARYKSLLLGLRRSHVDHHDIAVG